jgi:hypothetical protein
MQHAEDLPIEVGAATSQRVILKYLPLRSRRVLEESHQRTVERRIDRALCVEQPTIVLFINFT